MSVAMNDFNERRTATSPKEDTVPAVAFNDVVKRYSPSALKAVNGVSFEVREGELVVLLGPSGCGKTTSLRLIAGLEEPDSGSISISGQAVSSPEQGLFVPAEKRGIGMVFQSYAIWPHMSVFQNVAYPLRVRRMSKRLMRERVEAALEMVGLAGMIDRSATKLSGGQQQRVALARSLVFEPRLLLLDEPLSNLDAKLRAQMRTEIKQLQRKAGVASVFVTHDQAESMALADRIIVMNHGTVEQVGSPSEIYERPKTQFVAEFIGSSNLFAGRVASESAPTAFVRVRLRESQQELHCRPAADLVLGEGQEVFVVVRPEKLSMSREAGASPGVCGLPQNIWDCQVQTAVYYGDRREYQVVVRGPALQDHVLNVRTGPEVAFQRGERAYVMCSPNDLVVARGSA